MCRRNKVWAAAVIGFGLGMLFAGRVGGGFFSVCFSLGLICVGVLLLQKQL